MADRASVHPDIHPPLLSLDVESFVGQRAADIEAAVSAAGGQLRVVRPGDGRFADFRPNRVNVSVDGDGVILAIPDFG
jgi:hypothetical protein